MNPRAALLAALSLLACTREAPAPEPPPLTGFEWLTGCWLSRDGAVERWESPAGAEMSGTSLFPQDDGTQISQSLRIATDSDGSTYFYARLGDASAEVRYQLVSASEREAVFENADNIGAKRIVYRVEGNALTSILSESLAPGARNWTTRFDACEGGAATP